jgi:sugar/nucleoside kinase (ribokinase family)
VVTLASVLVRRVRAAAQRDRFQDARTEPQDVPAPPARVVDPTGGGEILAGVFIALCAEGLPDIGALTYAVRAATRCVEEFGVRGPRLVACLADIRNEVQRTGTR